MGFRELLIQKAKAVIIHPEMDTLQDGFNENRHA